MKEKLNLIFDKYVENGKIEPYVNGEKIVHDIKTYFEYVKMIIDEINKIKNIVAEFPESKESEKLLWELDCIIYTLIYFKNNYKDFPCLPIDPEIFIGKYYIKLNYYKMNKDYGTLYYESPSTMAFERNLQFVYVIDEVYSIVPEEGEPGYEDYNDEFNIGYQKMHLYAIDSKNKKIYSMIEDRIGQTYDETYFSAREDMGSMINKLLDSLKETSKDTSNTNKMSFMLKNNQSSS